MINFPDAPVAGQTYTFGDRTWRWNGAAWARLVNQGQGVAVFVPVGTLVEQTVTALPYLVSGAFHQITYV